MPSSIEEVSEYNEKMCDLCVKFDYGTFVVINNHRVCQDCCKEIEARLKINEYESQLRNR